MGQSTAELQNWNPRPINDPDEPADETDDGQPRATDADHLVDPVDRVRRERIDDLEIS